MSRETRSLRTAGPGVFLNRRGLSRHLAATNSTHYFGYRSLAIVCDAGPKILQTVRPFLAQDIEELPYRSIPHCMPLTAPHLSWSLCRAQASRNTSTLPGLSEDNPDLTKLTRATNDTD